jgi:hypothetical protein
MPRREGVIRLHNLFLSLRRLLSLRNRSRAMLPLFSIGLSFMGVLLIRRRIRGKMRMSGT